MINIKNFFLQPFHDPDKKKSSHGDSLLALDGLRGIAVIVVLASHTAAFGMKGNGSVGVFLFFFLSGFVLALPYCEDIKQARQPSKIMSYFLNRTLRILPIYIVAVITMDLTNGGNSLTINWEWVLYNISFLKGWNHLWSVAEEVRFYVLFPFLLLFLSFLPGKVTQIIVVCLFTYLFYRYRSFHKIDLMDGRFVNFYFWIFLGGVTTCLAYKRSLTIKVFDSRYLSSIFSISAWLILLFIFFSSTHMVKTFWQPLLPSIPDGFRLNAWRIPHIWFFLFSILLFSVTRYSESIPSRFLKSYFLRHIGLLSYSLYLFHIPIVLKSRKLGFTNEGMFAIVFIFTYGISILTYILIEKPFLSLKYKFRQKKSPIENDTNHLEKPETLKIN